MLKITKVLALIICLCFSSVFTQAQEDSDKFVSKKVMDFDNFNPQNAAQFIQGYFIGAELFKDVLDSSCIQNSEVVVEDALEIFDILKDFKADIHIFSNIKEIITATESIVSHFTNESNQCKAAGEIALVDIHKIVDRVSQDGYLKELGSHAYKNIGDIETLVENGYTSFHEGEMLEAGINFGKATKLVGFWDL